MAKKIKAKKQVSAIKAIVRTDIFRQRIEKPLKGNGSYRRQAFKKGGREGYQLIIVKWLVDSLLEAIVDVLKRT
jgi:stalled ribosome alternative rescue factor ArfA